MERKHIEKNKKNPNCDDNKRKFFINVLFIVSYFATDLFTFSATILRCYIQVGNTGNIGPLLRRSKPMKTRYFHIGPLAQSSQLECCLVKVLFFLLIKFNTQEQ